MLRETILDAAVAEAALHGIRRLSVVDVARRAGISRPTLYKHFPSKDALVAEAVRREAERLTSSVLDAAAGHDSPERALEAGILAALRLTREHPLLDRLIATEPESLVPLVLSDGGPVMLLVRRTIERMVAEELRAADALVVRRVADLLTRLLLSYALSAPDDPPEVVAAAVAAMVAAGVESRSPSPSPSRPRPS
ncbi:MAG: TetR family transcriptional regulator [Acidimicrobiia bacterium]|nr:TetR family transcriptional regulator [Acidimicrobiia bacterium]